MGTIPPNASYSILLLNIINCVMLMKRRNFLFGIELGNAQNGTVDLGRFSLDNMESVTLYNGQK